jgi:VWFA-related protein
MPKLLAIKTDQMVVFFSSFSAQGAVGNASAQSTSLGVTSKNSPKSAVKLPLFLLILCCACLCAAQDQQSSVISPPENSKQAAAQPPSASESLSPLLLRINTRMVLVDAVVTDRRGKPVTDLTADDFAVMEDGKKQTIKSFSLRTLMSAGATSAPRSVTLPGFYSNVPDVHTEEGPPIIILLDALNTPYADQIYAREQLLSYLKQLGPRQNMAIYILGSKLSMLQGFTDDPQILQQAVARVLGKSHPTNTPANGLPATAPPSVTAPSRATGPPVNAPPRSVNVSLIDRPRQSTLNSITNPTVSDPGGLDAVTAKLRASLLAQEDQGQIDYRIRATLLALRQIARNCAGYPGRKNLIWLSTAFPLSNEVVSNGPYYEDFRKTGKLLADAQTAVYPIDPRGVSTFAPAEMAAGSADLRDTHASMNYVANWTGGRASYERNDIGAEINQAVQDGATYYLLGYYPLNKNWNGAFRKTQVKLLRAGLHVRSRQGYFATDVMDKNPMRVNAALQEFIGALDLDSPNSTMLPVTAHVIPPASDHSQVFLDVGVDPHSVMFEPQADNLQESYVEFITVVHDAQGKTVVTKSDLLKTNATAQTYAKIMSGSLAIRQKFNLMPGKYLIRIGVRDAKSNLIGTLTAKVEVMDAK